MDTIPDAVRTLHERIVQFWKGPDMSACFEAMEITHQDDPRITNLYHFNLQKTATVSKVTMDSSGVLVSTSARWPRLKVEIRFIPSEAAPEEHGSFRAVVSSRRDGTLVDQSKEYTNGFEQIIKTYVHQVETAQGLHALCQSCS